jgi:TonB family protein
MRFRRALVVSLIVHGVALAYFAQFAPKPMERKFITPFQMVELAEKGRGGAPSGSRAVAPQPAPRSRPEEIPPPPKPAAKEAPSKPAPKASAPKPAPEPKPAPVPPSARAIPKDATKPQPAPAKPAPSYSEKDVEEKLRKIRQKFASTDTAPNPRSGSSDAGVRSAVEAIRRRVGEPQPSRTGANQGAAHVAGPELPKGGGGGGGVSPEELKWSMYYNRVWAEVESNWAVPPSVTGKRYVTIVAVVLDRRGNVLKNWIEESSGNAVYDEAAVKAILRSAPLPSLPPDISDATVPLGFRFIE